MSQPRNSASGRAATSLILEVFRLNGRLLLAGDRLVSDLGLTSARWQVLGAIAYATQPQPVAWLARSMGLNRQGVQRIVNEMLADGFVELQQNPNHRRAHHVVLTPKGRSVYEAAERLQAPWISDLVKGLPAATIESTTRLMETLRERLEANERET